MDNLTVVERNYIEFYKKNGYIPEIFLPFYQREITDICPTLTTECAIPGTSSGIMIIELKGINKE